MNLIPPEMDLGYDPDDLHSFPYQQNEPPFDATSLVLDGSTLAHANKGNIDIMHTIATLIGYDDDGPENYRMLDMALRLFYKMAPQSEVNFPTLFAACCDTALIWERG